MDHRRAIRSMRADAIFPALSRVPLFDDPHSLLLDRIVAVVRRVARAYAWPGLVMQLASSLSVRRGTSPLCFMASRIVPPTHLLFITTSSNVLSILSFFGCDTLPFPVLHSLVMALPLSSFRRRRG